MIVGFNSFGNSGKSTAAEVLHAILSPNVATVSFADVMKRFCENELGFDHDTLYGPSHKRTGANFMGMEARRTLQTLGDWGRTQNPMLWVRLAFRTIDRLAAEYFLTLRHFIMPDHRYQNEMEEARRRGSLLIRVRRDGVERSTVQGGVPGHSSETDMESIPDSFFDHLIVTPDFGDNEIALRFFLWENLRIWAYNQKLIPWVWQDANAAERLVLGGTPETDSEISVKLETALHGLVRDPACLPHKATLSQMVTPFDDPGFKPS